MQLATAGFILLLKVICNIWSWLYSVSNIFGCETDAVVHHVCVTWQLVVLPDASDDQLDFYCIHRLSPGGLIAPQRFIVPLRFVVVVPLKQLGLR